MVFDHLDDFSDRVAAITDDKEYSYRELLSLANQICKSIKEGELVLLLAENTVETIAAYIGLLRKRSPVMILSAGTPIESVRDIVGRFCPIHIIGRVDLNDVKYRVVEHCCVKITSLICARNCPINKDMALLLTTSGSTGSPKFVRLSYNNILSNTKSICNYLKISNSDVGVTCLPLNYSFGLSILNTHLYSGAKMLITSETYLSTKFWDLIQTYKVTTFSGVPYSFSILKRIGLHRFDLSNVRYVTQAGGKLAKENVEYWYNYFSNMGIDFIVMYGQTEATARMSYLPKEDISSHYGSIGIAIPGGKFTLKKNGTTVSSPGVEGELVYEGENVSMGYAESIEDLSLPDMNKGVLYTGDLAYYDQDGFFYITGRIKRFIKLFGNRTNLDDLEKLLERYGISALCSGQDDNLRIYIKDSSLCRKVEDILREYTLISPLSYKIIVLDEFPISESGKVLYAKLPY